MFLGTSAESFSEAYSVINQRSVFLGLDSDSTVCGMVESYLISPGLNLFVYKRNNNSINSIEWLGGLT